MSDRILIDPDVVSEVRSMLLEAGAAMYREAEREERRRVTRDALARAKAEGVHVGRPRSLDPRARQVRPEAAERMERALARLRVLRRGGMSLRKIAAQMNDEGLVGPNGGRWHDRTVRLAIKRYGMGDA